MKDRSFSRIGSSLHEVALFGAVALGVLYWAEHPDPPPPGRHPAGCHACSAAPPGAAAARDAYLLRVGSVDIEDLPASERRGPE